MKHKLDKQTFFAIVGLQPKSLRLNLNRNGACGKMLRVPPGAVQNGLHRSRGVFVYTLSQPFPVQVLRSIIAQVRTPCLARSGKKASAADPSVGAQ